MKAATNLREKLGLSQEEMAQYLLVTRQLLSLYETGKRDLPAAALLKLAEIELFLSKPPLAGKKDRQHVQRQQEQAQQMIDEYAKEQAYLQQKTARKLKAVQKRYAQNMLLLDTLDYLQSDKKFLQNERSKAWLQMMQSQALDEIEQNGLHVQSLLQLQLNGFSRQAKQRVKDMLF